MTTLNQKRKQILSIIGGGLKGAMPAHWCTIIEFLSKRKINELFDYFSGTSVGAIIVACLAAGVPANEIEDLIVNHGAELFEEQGWYRRTFKDPDHAKYLRDKLYAVIETKLKEHGVVYMSDFKKPIAMTAYGLSAGRTHYILSWNKSHGKYKAVDVVAWSALSAAFYFGKINAPDFEWKDDFQGGVVYKGESFQDGGQGTLNCTAAKSLDTTMFSGTLGWKKEDDIHLLSLGCGSEMIRLPYGKVSSNKFGIFAQVKKYMFGGNGGAARTESVAEQLHEASWKLESMYGDKSHFCSINPVIPESINKLDGKEFIKQYVEIAKLAENQIPCFAITPKS